MTSWFSTFRISFFVVVPITVSLAVASDQAERVVVVVVSVAGDWKYQDARVKFGQSLPAKDCPFGSEGSVILQSDEKGPLPFACEQIFPGL